MSGTKIIVKGKELELPTGGGASSAENVSFDPKDTGLEAENVQDAITELFTSGSDGKALIASAITSKGVQTDADATFSELAENIEKISTIPDGIYKIELIPEPQDGGTVQGGGYASAGMECHAEAKANGDDNYVFAGWEEDGLSVDKNSNYDFLVDKNRLLVARFLHQQYMIGRDWHLGPSTPVVSSPYQYLAAVYSGNIFVAVSNNSNKAIYSYDGLNWETTDMPYTSNWPSVAFGNGKFVAIAGFSSATNQAAYSDDGINWTATGNLPFSAYWSSIAYGNGKFVAVAGTYWGSSAKGAYSDDGINWEENSMPNNKYNTVTFGNGIFVALGHNTNKGAYSEDGVIWEEITMPFSAQWTDVTYGNGMFVACAGWERSYNKFAYSMDGKNWKETTAPYSFMWQRVCYGDAMFVAVGNGQYVAYSKDGINWDGSSLPSSSTWNALVYGDDKFVALTQQDNLLAYSYNG